MDILISLVGVAIGLLALAALASPFILVSHSRKLKDMAARIALLEAARSGLSSQAGQPVEAPAPARPALEERPESNTQPQDAAKPDIPKTVAAKPAFVRAVHKTAPPASSRPVTPRKPGRARGFEEAFAASWMIWIGAVAIALSAVFLFGFAVEQGWLGPRVRVGMGLALGGALVAAGEWTYRHRLPAITGVRPEYGGPALTSTGIFALFASLYAAYALYGLYGAGIAFALLGAVSFAGLVLALRQGWPVALIAVAGGFLIPALLRPDAPEAAPVFLFLFVLTAAGLALMTARNWRFLAAAVMLGALGWPVLWTSSDWTIADQGVLSAYVLGIALLFGFFAIRIPSGASQMSQNAWLARALGEISGLGFAACGAILLMLAVFCDFNSPSFMFIGLYAGLALLTGLWRPQLDYVIIAAAAVALASVLIWPQPRTVSVSEELQRLGVASYASTYGPFVMPPEFLTFARALLGFAVIFGLAGFAALRSVPRPGVWAAVSAAMPLALLVTGYWRIGAFEIDVRWSALAVALSAAFLGAASLTGRLLPSGKRDLPLSLYAAGSTAALALAFTCLFREAWLTVALALEVLALAWIWARLRVRQIRWIALGLIAIVGVRLILNFHILDYHGSAAGMFSWVIYGYGIPALAFYGAARLFDDPKDDPLAALCQIAALAFGFLMVALQLRAWTSGAIAAPRYNLFDMAVQTIWWLVAGGLLLRRELVARLPWAWFAGAGLLVLALLQIALGHLIRSNPLIAHEPAGSFPVLNLLGLAYLVPALLIATIGSTARIQIPERWRAILKISSGVLVFVYITLEVRHAFNGSSMWVKPDETITGGEIYSYSAAWIIFALAILAAGFIRHSQMLRAFSLAVLIGTVLKVFLYDMSDLTGLLRVASFLGLGLVLIGIGQIYRRYIFNR